MESILWCDDQLALHTGCYLDILEIGKNRRLVLGQGHKHGASLRGEVSPNRLLLFLYTFRCKECAFRDEVLEVYHTLWPLERGSDRLFAHRNFSGRRWIW